ncbi:SUKH-4 family immunity protein [Streptomyces sp. NPDC002088]|uniref:SUKH-4 family immunity protein n=1 Tax=Streptomyces sp. NPDC002088 TaxID=3154665 RepID=UPI0033253293
MAISSVNISVAGGGPDFIVPSGFFAYRTLELAERVDAGERRFLIRFGIIGRVTSVFLDEDSWEVLSGLYSGDVVLVNASMSKFMDCISGLADMVPFYSADSDSGEWEAAAQRVQEFICEVDPSAYYEGGFWYDFRWDVSMGDFHE